MVSQCLKEARAILETATKMVSNMEDSQYDWEHDEDFNLYFKMRKGKLIKIPVLALRPYQLAIQKILFGGISKRILVSWPRRSGKEVVTWNFIVQAAITTPGMYIMTYPTNVRARKILWQGAALINGVSKRFLDMIPEELLARKPNDAEMTIELINGSLIWIVGCDIDPGKLRGTNPLGIVFSELAFSDPRVLYTMLPVLRQNGGWLVGQSTYDGMNHFFHMLKNNMKDPLWHCREESILTLLDENGNPYITEEDVDEDRRAGMPEYLIQQEYYGNVQINEETKYFAVAINKVYETERIISGLYLPNKNVYAFFDIGVNDCTAITLAQFESRGSKLWPVVIGYIENNNRDLRFYVNEIRMFCARYNLIFKAHFIPHDGKNRSFNDGLKNTVDYLNEMGEIGYFVNRPSSHKTAIESIRQKLFMTSFNKENTQRLIDCLSNYEKEFDEKLGRFKDSPVHDWSSHGVKSYQTLVLAMEAELIVETTYDVVYLP
jgi:phage terminase large subunit